MKRIAELFLVLATVSGPALQALAQSRAAELPADWKAAMKEFPAPRSVAEPVAAPPQETRVYQRAGYAWESDAQSAMRTAEESLKAAGFSLLAGQIISSGGRYSFRIEHFAGGNDPRYQWSRVEAYASQPAYAWDSDAQAGMKDAAANLRRQGFHVILGQVLSVGGRYQYEIDYLRSGDAPRRPGRETKVYQRAGYAWQADAQSAMGTAEASLKAAGFSLLAGQIIPSGGRYDLRVEYFSNGTDPRFRWSKLETYASQPSYSWDSDAQNGMKETMANLSRQGFHLILGQVQSAGGRYRYEIDYLRPGRPAPELLQSGGPYRREEEARRTLRAASELLEAAGNEIVKAETYQEPGSRWFKFRIIYREIRR